MLFHKEPWDGAVLSLYKCNFLGRSLHGTIHDRFVIRHFFTVNKTINGIECSIAYVGSALLGDSPVINEVLVTNRQTDTDLGTHRKGLGRKRPRHHPIDRRIAERWL